MTWPLAFIADAPLSRPPSVPRSCIVPFCQRNACCFPPGVPFRANDLPPLVDRRGGAARPARPERPEIGDGPARTTARVRRGVRSRGECETDADDDRQCCKGCATHDSSLVSIYLRRVECRAGHAAHPWTADRRLMESGSQLGACADYDVRRRPTGRHDESRTARDPGPASGAQAGSLHGRTERGERRSFRAVLQRRAHECRLG